MSDVKVSDITPDDIAKVYEYLKARANARKLAGDLADPDTSSWKPRELLMHPNVWPNEGLERCIEACNYAPGGAFLSNIGLLVRSRPQVLSFSERNSDFVYTVIDLL
jgi:hypothetical protein